MNTHSSTVLEFSDLCFSILINQWQLALVSRFLVLFTKAFLLPTLFPYVFPLLWSIDHLIYTAYRPCTLVWHIRRNIRAQPEYNDFLLLLESDRLVYTACVRRGKTRCMKALCGRVSCQSSFSTRVKIETPHAFLIKCEIINKVHYRSWWYFTHYSAYKNAQRRNQQTCQWN